MKKVIFVFNKKARAEAIKALDKLIAFSSPTSVFFSIFLKEMHDRIILAVCSFGLTGLFLLIKVLVSCFEDVNHNAVVTTKKSGSTSNKSSNDTS